MLAKLDFYCAGVINLMGTFSDLIGISNKLKLNITLR